MLYYIIIIILLPSWEKSKVKPNNLTRQDKNFIGLYFIPQRKRGKKTKLLLRGIKPPRNYS